MSGGVRWCRTGSRNTAVDTLARPPGHLTRLLRPGLIREVPDVGQLDALAGVQPPRREEGEGAGEAGEADHGAGGVEGALAGEVVCQDGGTAPEVADSEVVCGGAGLRCGRGVSVRM